MVSYMIEPYKAPNNHVGEFIYSIIIKSISMIGILRIKCIQCLLFQHKEIIHGRKSPNHESQLFRLIDMPQAIRQT